MDDVDPMFLYILANLERGQIWNLEESVERLEVSQLQTGNRDVKD